MKLSEKIQDFSSVILLIMLVINIVFIYVINTTKKPQIVYQVTHSSSFDPSIDSLRPLVENIVKELQPVFSSSSSFNSSQTYPYPYDYMIVEGRRVIRSMGRYYSEGSPTSYGVIQDIYPDRVLLENGIILVNSTPFDHRQPINAIPAVLPVKEESI